MIEDTDPDKLNQPLVRAAATAVAAIPPEKTPAEKLTEYLRNALDTMADALRLAGVPDEQEFETELEIVLNERGFPALYSDIRLHKMRIVLPVKLHHHSATTVDNGWSEEVDRAKKPAKKK
jgi:hypothetical protein